MSLLISWRDISREEANKTPFPYFLIVSFESLADTRIKGLFENFASSSVGFIITPSAIIISVMESVQAFEPPYDTIQEVPLIIL